MRVTRSLVTSQIRKQQDSLTRKQFKIPLGYHAMSHKISHWPLTTEVLVQFQTRPCVTCGGLSDPRTGSFPRCFSFLWSLSFHQCPILIHLSVTTTVQPQQLTMSNSTFHNNLLQSNIMFLYILIPLHNIKH